MKYRVYRRSKFDKRAPSQVDLADEYKYLGDVEAVTVGEAARKWINQEDTKVRIPIGAFNFYVGDVMTVRKGPAYIHTGDGIWALVELVK